MKPIRIDAEVREIGPLTFVVAGTADTDEKGDDYKYAGSTERYDVEIRGDVLSGVHNYTNAMRLGTRVKLTIEVMEEP